MVSERESEIREVTCQRCGTVNPVRMGMSGTQTIFCKGCGKEIKLIYDRSLMGLELKKETRNL